MSAKTCQLCGKPLGRMRSGDGDFCSREHRNQFRMRQGMDRLEEANKVASLMRRRENPKQIPAARLLASAAQTYRASLEPAQFPVRPVESNFKPMAPRLFQVRITDIPERLSRPITDLARRCTEAEKRTITPESMPFAGARARTPMLGANRSRKPSAGVTQAPAARLRRWVPAGADTRRECGAALRASRSAVLPTARFGVETAAAARLEGARQLRALAATAIAECRVEPRTSAGVYFERRRPALPGRAATLKGAGEWVHSQPPASRPPDAREFPVETRTCPAPRLEIVLRLPGALMHQGIPGARRQDAAPIEAMRGEGAVAAMPRVLGLTWDGDSSIRIPSLRATGFEGGSLGSRKMLPLRAICDALREHRPAEVRFLPGDSAFDHVSMDLQGSLGPGSEPARPAAGPIEEHFNSGLEEWAGDTTEWRLDAAGARPAGLALFKPTLGLSDYEFEFFTRIEARAVTFVFRASNASNYHKVTIAMVESGRYELRRRAVIGGVEEPAATAPLPGVLRPGAAFTVKTRASQNDFTVWLDGERAAKWTDGRLPAGGIGFMAPRDDRARVYWVRLSQPDGPTSPAAPRPARSIQ